MDAILIGLILLHGPSGAEILLNPESITSMHFAMPGKKNELVAHQAKCVINTTDGKFISVLETCDIVRKLIKEADK